MNIIDRTKSPDRKIPIGWGAHVDCWDKEDHTVYAMQLKSGGDIVVATDNHVTKHVTLEDIRNSVFIALIREYTQ